MSELLDRILSRNNMNLAYKRVKANKGAGGIDEVEVDELYSYIKENWKSIEEQIRQRTYKPQPVRSQTEVMDSDRTEAAKWRYAKSLNISTMDTHG